MVMKDLTLEQAADVVASRVVGCTVKRAWEMPEAVTNTLRRAGTAAQDFAGKIDPSNPLHAALLAGGVGAGGGAISSLLSSDKEKRKRWLQNALFGGAVGGIGGGAASALYGQLGPGGALTKYDQTQIDAANKPQAPTLQESATHAYDNTGIPEAVNAVKGTAKAVKDQVSNAYNSPQQFFTAPGLSTAMDAVTAPVSNAISQFKESPGKAMLPAGAAAGYGADKLLNQHAINKGQQKDLQAALADPKFKGTVSNMNKLRESSGRAPVTDSHLGNLEAELGKSFMERLGLGGKPKVAPATTATPAPASSPAQSLSSAIPPQRPPAAPTAPKAAPPLTGEPLQHLTRTAVQSRGAQSATPKRRSGVRGALLGAGAGFLANTLGAPQLSPKQKRQQAGQPLIQN